MIALLTRLVRNHQGATAIEYALMCALIAIVCIPAMQAVASAVTEAFNSVASATPVD